MFARQYRSHSTPVLPVTRRRRTKGMGKFAKSNFGLAIVSRRGQLLAILCSIGIFLVLLTSPWKGNLLSRVRPKKMVELPTRWSKYVTEDNVLPEYPRPQLRRQHWLSLNGIWEFQEVLDEDELPPFGKKLKERILVPFPVESDLSGVRRYMPRMWYRKLFTVPSTWEGSRVMLNFGAVDWQCQAFLNGNELGVHTGGYDKFSFDLTDQLDEGGENELVVGVYDPTNSADGVPLGKQRSHYGHRQAYGSTNIVYTSSSGIWQTVWLEPVPLAHIIRADFVPNIDSRSVSVQVLGSAAATGRALQISIAEDLHGPEVAVHTSKVGEKQDISIPRPKLWSPDSPHLYQVKLQVIDEHAAGAVDEVAAYFGMRKVDVSKDLKGRPRIKLNNRPEMHIGLLDQGFWPDGLHTAPSDEALVFDIQSSKDMGFNVLRKHIKVEPDRWYFHADRLGMMVWQDMPSMCGMLNTSFGSDWYAECMNAKRPIPPHARKQFEAEMGRHIEEHVSFPSIVMYVIFNEGWGQYETERVTALAMEQDPSRVYNAASGWNDAAAGHVVDIHDYKGVQPARPAGHRASVLGEFGGLGLALPLHTYMLAQNASSYLMFESAAQLNAKYLDYLQTVKLKMLDPDISLSAVIYTELTDVEHEVNGWLTYDREAVKADVASLSRAHRDIIEASREL